MLTLSRAFEFPAFGGMPKPNGYLPGQLSQQVAIPRQHLLALSAERAYIC